MTIEEPLLNCSTAALLAESAADLHKLENVDGVR